MISIFGPEYANGAFVARLHFQDRGKIHVSINAQSEFEDFGIKRVASEAQLYFITETALLDNFITELKSLNNGISEMCLISCFIGKTTRSRSHFSAEQGVICLKWSILKFSLPISIGHLLYLLCAVFLQTNPEL